MFELLDYSRLFLWLSFAFCLALTAGGILVIFRFGKIKRLVALQYLQYFLILLYVFGFYSLWSKILLSQFTDIENIERLSTIVSQLGIPFFIISLIMQLIWTNAIQTKPSKLVVPITLLTIIALEIVFLQWGWPVVETLRAIYSLAAFVFTMAVISLFIRGDKLALHGKWGIVLIGLFACAGSIHLSYFTSLAQSEYYETAFVFLFFLFNTTATVMYLYTAKAEPVSHDFEGFVLKHGISRRETDIIQGIYAGQTNQEIADQLFITLQTVKDHSSRIYQKTQVKNRGQLVTLLRECQ